MTADDPEYVLVGGLDAKARAHTRTGGMNDDERYGDRTEVGHFNTDNKAGSTGTTVRSPSSISHAAVEDAGSPGIGVTPSFKPAATPPRDRPLGWRGRLPSSSRRTPATPRRVNTRQLEVRP